MSGKMMGGKRASRAEVDDVIEILREALFSSFKLYWPCRI